MPCSSIDRNHKPELAMALTNMEALCSFRPIFQIQNFLHSIPELRNCVSENVVEQFLKLQSTDDSEKTKKALKALFSSLMHQPVEKSSRIIRTLIERLKARKASSNKLIPEEELAIRLDYQFPSDIGILSVFLLNYLSLKPGEAIFLAANEPHAYLSGDCAECMACSDNVVRAGLTTKPKDVDVLCSMLTFEPGMPRILTGEILDPCTRIYRPPVVEFCLERIELSSRTSMHCILHSSGAPSLLLVVNGEGFLSLLLENELSSSIGNASEKEKCTESEVHEFKSRQNLKVGNAFVIAAYVSLEVVTSASKELLLLRCAVNL